jgi:hypothetical protein
MEVEDTLLCACKKKRTSCAFAYLNHVDTAIHALVQLTIVADYRCISNAVARVEDVSLHTTLAPVGAEGTYQEFTLKVLGTRSRGC